VYDTDDSEDVIPVSASESDNCTNNNRNNICNMEGDNGSDGYSKNLISKNGLVCTTCKPKVTHRKHSNVTYISYLQGANRIFSGNLFTCRGIQTPLDNRYNYKVYKAEGAIDVTRNGTQRIP
jgi:hypothetical protein